MPAEFPAPESTAIWGDAAVWVPWALWQAYGDRDGPASASTPAMAAHVRRVETLLSPTGLWDTGFQFGDWLDPDAPPDAPAEAKADNGVVATACLYRSAAHRRRDRRAARQRRRTRPSFAALRRPRRGRRSTSTTSRDDGTVRSDAPTVYALAIVFGLLDERRPSSWPATGSPSWWPRAATASRPASPARRSSPTRSPTTGHLDDAYRLLLQRECPSWLYPVTMGATTIWERWDSMLPDGTINPGEMTSFNHYALGAVADWMHRTIGGIAPAEPGYAKVLVAPRPGGGLTWAEPAWRRDTDGSWWTGGSSPECSRSRRPCRRE